jgi:hypothetical protein
VHVGESLTQVFYLSCICSACHYDVVDVCENISLHLVFGDGLCHPTECGAGILEAFAHPKIIVGAEGCDKACFFSILYAELDLMVSREAI